MKKCLKIAAALTAAALVGGAAFAQTQSNTNVVTQGVFSTDIDNYGNVRNWSTVEIDKAFLTAEASAKALTFGAAGNAGALYMAGWYKGNFLSRVGATGGTLPETNSFNFLVGFGRDALPMGLKFKFDTYGEGVQDGLEVVYTPGVAFGMRMAGLGPFDLFRLEAGVDIPLFGTRYVAAAPALHLSRDADTVGAQINITALAQMNFGRHGLTVHYKPSFEAVTDTQWQNSNTNNRQAWSSHDIKFGYTTSKDFGDGLKVGIDAGANFKFVPHKKDSTTSILTSTVAPYVAGAMILTPKEIFSINMGIKFAPTYTDTETTTKNGKTSTKTRTWSWTPDVSFGAGFTLNMTDNAWFDASVWTYTNAPTAGASPVAFNSLDNLVSKLSVQLGLKF